MDLQSLSLHMDDKDSDQIIFRESCYEIIQDQCEFHCLCFKNPIKHQSMKDRFNQLGLNLQIYDGVSHIDRRIVNGVDPCVQVRSRDVLLAEDVGNRNISLATQRLWSVTYGHLDMIQQFYNSGKNYGLFCEDDIVVNRTLPFNLPFIMSECNEMQLDVCLLGYMKTYKVEGWLSGHETVQFFPDRPYSYHRYPQDQWGVHLYMLSREGAKKVLDTYGAESGYADKYADDPSHPFSPDWTITKCPGLNRALISPLFAVEDGRDAYEHYAHDGQYKYHMDTFNFNYVPDLFI